MNEWPKAVSAEAQNKAFGQTPIAELLPGINTEAIKEGDFDQLRTYVKTNETVAAEAGQLTEATMLDTGYAGHLVHELEGLKHSDPETFQQIQDAVGNKVLVDLAAGSKEYGYTLARMLGSKAYVGVEPYNAPRLTDTIVYKEGKKAREEQIPYAVVAEDILTFLKRLGDTAPDVAFLSSGSDGNIFPDPSHNEQIAREIERVLSFGSGIVFNDSVFAKHLNPDLIELRTIPGRNRYLGVRR